MTTLTDRIKRIAPQYQPDAEDVRWLESELDRVADRALPKLIRKRFVETLRSSGRVSRTQPAPSTAKATASTSSTSVGASVGTK